MDARWTKKNGKSYFGYKNHVCIDNKYKLVRKFGVTHAALHDSQYLENLLDDNNTSSQVWADSAYRSRANFWILAQRGFQERFQRKSQCNQPLTKLEKQGNRTRSRIRCRVEHVFAAQLQKAGSLILRSIGLARAYVKIGLRNLAYNMDRYSLLASN